MVEEAIAELRRLLAEEREAIRRLDASRVLEFARRKQELVETLRDARGSFSPATAAALRSLVPALRHNGILLAHARDILRDAVAVASRGRFAMPQRARPQGSPRKALSVRG